MIIMNILLRKESNSSGGAEEGSNSHTQYHDAKSKETFKNESVLSKEYGVKTILGTWFLEILTNE